MKVSKWIVLIHLILCTYLFGSQNIFVDGRILTFQNDIIEYKHNSYFPLREFTDFYKTPIKYSRKEDSYSTILNGSTIKLFPNSREILINNQSQFLSSPVIFHERTLYVPMESFVLITGFELEDKGNNLFISSIKSAQPVLEDTSNTDSINFLNFKSSPIDLPDLFPDQETYISFELRTYPLNPITFYEKNILYINPKDILEKEGFEIKKTDTTLTLSNKTQSLTFSTTSSEVIKKSSHTTSETLQSQSPSIIKDSDFYVPFKSLLASLNLSIDWDKKHRIITLLNQLQTLELTSKNDQLVINLTATLPIAGSTPIKLEDETGYHIDMDFASIPAKITKDFPKNPILKSVSLKQFDKKTVRITILLHEARGISAIKPTKTGGEIAFRTSATNILETALNGSETVTIKANGKLSYASWKTDDNQKLVIDIPETLNELPFIIRNHSQSYHRIRTSQLQNDPPITRVVIDLVNPDTTYTIAQKDTHSLAINFSTPLSQPVIADSTAQKTPEPKTKPTPKPTITPPKPLPDPPAVVKPAPKPKPQPKNPVYKPPVLSQGKGLLANKVIAIDPGHGGADPGAVIKRTIFEKGYCLDISKRLQRLLESEGAFVVMARESDKHVGLQRRADIANLNKADALISIHINSFTSPTARGTETYYYKPKDLALAKSFQNELVKSLGRRNNGVKRARMYILRRTSMPGALVEPLFITNPEEFALLDTPAYREKIAQALFDGFKNYFESNP